MEKAGHLNEDDEADDEEIESKFSLGTPATRAGIIELLQKRNYISKKEKSLIPTEDGLIIYDVIKELPIVDIKTTGKWEYALKCIQQKTLSKERFQAEIEKYTATLITEIKEIKAPTTLNQNTRPSEYGLCPKCKKQGLRDWPKSVSCPDREGCKFIIWKKIAKKTLGVTALKALASKKETKELKGFKSKAGKTFNAKLKLDDGFKVRFVFKD
jgi:DNA topoisomerase-3